MSSLVLSCPGKSFLAGEYLAIKEGPSLVFTSSPRFELICKEGTGLVQGIHADSPAGKLIHDHPGFFNKHDLHFVDPHQGRGGFGASTAQFLLSFVLNEWRESCELETLKSLSISRLLDHYWKYAWTGEGARPSGTDLVAQYKGYLTLFEKRSGIMSVYRWVFGDIDFALIATGQKVPTHEHLKSLGDFNEAGIESAMKALQKSLQNADGAEFVEGIRAAGAALETLGFVAPGTKQLLQKFAGAPGVLAAKGCGALGADVILVVFERKQRSAIESFAAALGLTVTATSENLSHGLEIQVRNS